MAPFCVTIGIAAPGPAPRRFFMAACQCPTGVWREKTSDIKTKGTVTALNACGGQQGIGFLETGTKIALPHPKPQPNADDITQAELARRLGVTHQAVTALKRDGKVVMRGAKVAFAATMERLEASLHPSYSHKALKAARSRGGSGETGEEPAEPEIERISLAEAQRRKAIAAANIAELEYAEKSGTLIDKIGAEKAIFEFVRGLRDAIENVPTRYAAQIGAELGVPAARVSAALSKRLKDLLGELADRQLRL